MFASNRFFAVVLLLALCAAPASAADKLQTTIEIQLLTLQRGPGSMRSIIAAQEWGRVFSRLGHSANIRSAIGAEQPEIRQKVSGRVRRLTVVGVLDDSGRAVFPKQIFTTADSKRIREWLTELETYGQQGATAGKPLWGLNEAQFADFYRSVSGRLESEIRDVWVYEAVKKLGLPSRLKVRWSEDARSALEDRINESNVRQSLAGLSQATALAVALREQGLGFRPDRTPSERIELLITPLRKGQAFWPTGWELKESRLKTARPLFELVPVNLEDAAFNDIVDIVEQKTGIRVLFDLRRIESEGVNLGELTVSTRPRKMTFYGLLETATVRNRLRHRLVIDEAGQPFIWITTFAADRERREADKN